MATRPHESSRPGNLAYYTPSEIEEICRHTLDSGLETAPILVKGVFEDMRGKAYGEYFFDRFRDPTTNRTLPLKTHQALRVSLKPGNVYTLKGILDHQCAKQGDLNLKPVFMPSEIMEETKPIVDERVEAEALVMKTRLRKGHADVGRILARLLLEGVKPRILIIYGSAGIVDKDVERGLADARRCFELEEVRVNFSDKRAIIGLLQKADNARFHILALARGGGAGLEVFSDIDIAQAIVASRTPVVAALGHDSDETLVKNVADRSFPVPYALGEFLRSIVVEVAKNSQDASQAAVKEEALQKQVTLLTHEQSRDTLLRGLKYGLIVGGLAGAIATLLAIVIF